MSFNPSKSTDDIELRDPSFVNSFRWLVWKNFRQSVIRRPCSFLIRIFLPSLFMLILFGLRETYDIDKYIPAVFDTNTADDYGGYLLSSDLSEYGVWFAEQPSLNHSTFIEDLICFEHEEDDDGNEKDYDLPAFSIGFVPNPFDTYSRKSGLSETGFNRYKDFFNILNQTYQSQFGTNGWDEDRLKNITLVEYNSKLKAKNVDRCKVYAPYLPFEEGWLLRFFQDEDDLRDFVKKNNYGKNYLVSNQLHNRRPVGIAIVIDEISDDGMKWKYTMRFNSSRCGDTNEDIDEFTRSFVHFWFILIE